MPLVRLAPSGPLVTIGASNMLTFQLGFTVPALAPGEVGGALASAPEITRDHAVFVSARDNTLGDLLFEGLIVQAWPQAVGTIELALMNHGAAPIPETGVTAWAVAILVGD